MFLKYEIFNGAEDFVHIFCIDRSGEVVIKNSVGVSPGGNKHIQNERLHLRQVKRITLQFNPFIIISFESFFFLIFFIFIANKPGSPGNNEQYSNSG